MFTFATETKILEFIVTSLNFCEERIDTYAELLKDKATNFLVMMSASEASEYANLLCESSSRLIELLGSLVQDERQSTPVRQNICYVLGNIASEMNLYYK